ncbi:MAG: hypothetical protein ACEQSL_03605 [Sediminibacterium sp.]
MLTEPNYTKIIDFVQNLCEKHVDVGHSTENKRFFKSIEDFTGTNLAGNNVIFQPTPGNFENQHDAEWIAMRFALWHMTIFEREDENYNQERIDAMFVIANEFKKRIQNAPQTYDEADEDTEEQLIMLRIPEVSFDVIPNIVMDGWIGVRFEYTFHLPSIPDMDLTKWTDLAP